jgi:hypothetical protein
MVLRFTALAAGIDPRGGLGMSLALWAAAEGRPVLEDDAGASEIEYRGQIIVVWQEVGLWLAILKPADRIAWFRRSVPPGFYQDEVIENAKQTIDDGLRCDVSDVYMTPGAERT